MKRENYGVKPLFVLLLGLLFSLSLIGQSSVVSDPVSAEKIEDSQAKIHQDIRDELEGTEPVEALVMMKEKADTSAASQAVRQYAHPFADGEQVKSMVRHAVVDALKGTAEETQAPLLDYLEEEKEKGNVQEVNDFFIVNSLYVEAKPAVIKELSRESGVEKVYPNFEVEPLQEENLETGSSLV